MIRAAGTKTWVIGTAVLAVLLLAAAWLLAIDPVLAQAGEDREQAESARAQNDTLELEIARLKEQSTHLDEYRADLAALREQLPTTGDVSGLAEELQSLAEAAGVTVTTLAPGIPQAYVPPVTAPAADSATDQSAEGAAQTDGTGATDATATAGAATDTGTVSGLYTVPLTVTTVGSYQASQVFLRSLQTGSARLFLVSGVQAETQDDAGATGGRPATATGDLELTLTGSAFVLTDGTGATAAGTEGGTESEGTLPVPGDERNPFVPLH